MEYCIMCGKKHFGKYYVCDSCITENKLTQEQIIQMGGTREISESVSKAEKTKLSSQKNNAQKSVDNDEKLSTYSKEELQDDYLLQLHNIESKLGNLIEIENSNAIQNKKIDNAMHDYVVKSLSNIAKNVKTLKDIAVIMFILFVIGIVSIVYSLLVSVSY